ncbi:hypothetical protein OIU79_019228 [Salix purpurea]|uniref:Uncharacterized protein n=1 Tax=Salix purpurea TaxID=77065 RepID=A0A9Q0SJL1_SALPP|nr:hypothetical protein OIU79_019228 [Salix purpurea]
MTKRDFSGSEPDESENSSSEEGEEVGKKLKGITEYEKQRLSRIAENKARMEALGLNKMATSLMGSVQKSRQRKGKQKFLWEVNLLRSRGEVRSKRKAQNLTNSCSEAC